LRLVAIQMRLFKIDLKKNSKLLSARALHRELMKDIIYSMEKFT
jgi:hypothetical protein